MTGGFAYVLDEHNTFTDKLNHELVDAQRIDTEALGEYQTHLQKVIQTFVTETGSDWGQELLDNFTRWVGKFWLVKPKATNLEKLLETIKTRTE